MAADREKPKSPSTYQPYFVVSYAHLPEIADDPSDDEQVREFFGDLEAAVRRCASAGSGAVHGFFDQRIPAGSDRKTSLSDALGTAQVFVPLYSVGYQARSLPGREWTCFRQRVENAGLADPLSRILPVLWTPLPGTSHLPGLREAFALGRDVPGYAENGLWPMLRINSYRDSYWAVVSLLARKIVTLAEESPMRTSEVPDIDEIPNAFGTNPPLAVFSIETAGPSGRAAQGDPGGPGASEADWCPFAGQEQPLAQLVGQFAELADFQAEIRVLTTVTDPRTRGPGIILIDPLFIADEEGRRALESAVGRLPKWVVPLLILDRLDDSRTCDLASQVRGILSAARTLSATVTSRRAAWGISSLNEFKALMPKLVAETERQYLRYRSGREWSQPPRRPSLRRSRRDEVAAPPYEPASARDLLGETPDA